MHTWSHSSAELKMFCELISRTEKTNFLEIGCYKYGFTRFLAAWSGDKPLIVCNDQNDSPEARLIMENMLGPKSFRFVPGSSHDPEVVKQIVGLFRGKQIDLLFIDGDHSAKGIEADTINFESLVADDGYIVWHDTIRGSGERTEPWFIERLKRNFHINMFFDGSSRIAFIRAKEWRRNVAGNVANQFERA